MTSFTALTFLWGPVPPPHGLSCPHLPFHFWGHLSPSSTHPTVWVYEVAGPKGFNLRGKDPERVRGVESSVLFQKGWAPSAGILGTGIPLFSRESGENPGNGWPLVGYRTGERPPRAQSHIIQSPGTSLTVQDSPTLLLFFPSPRSSLQSRAGREGYWVGHSRC